MASTFGQKPLSDTYIREMLEHYRDYYAHDISNDELARLMDDWHVILNNDTKLLKAVLAERIKDIFKS